MSAKITTLSFVVSVRPSVHWSVPVELRHSYRTDVREITYCDWRHSNFFNNRQKADTLYEHLLKVVIFRQE